MDAAECFGLLWMEVESLSQCGACYALSYDHCPATNRASFSVGQQIVVRAIISTTLNGDSRVADVDLHGLITLGLWKYERQWLTFPPLRHVLTPEEAVDEECNRQRRAIPHTHYS
jgi:hypothetical protein